MTEYHLSAGALTFRYLPAEARLELIDAERHERLLLFPPNTAPLLPAAAERCQPPVVELREQELLFTTHTAAGLRVETKIRSCGDHFALSSSWLPIADYELTELPLFPAGTRLGLYQLVNFRNRHHTDQVWPELPLGFGECRTDTYSGDWFIPEGGNNEALGNYPNLNEITYSEQRLTPRIYQRLWSKAAPVVHNSSENLEEGEKNTVVPD